MQPCFNPPGATSSLFCTHNRAWTTRSSSLAQSHLLTNISCEGLVDSNASIGDCALGPYFTIDSDWASLELGRFRANIAFNLCGCFKSIITIDFGPDTKVTAEHDLYGARITEGGDGTSSSAVVSLLPLKHCLGMYKDQSCNNAIGFSAVVTPAMIELPRISCVLTRGLPEPPPPSPPNPPPSPPPGVPR